MITPVSIYRQKIANFELNWAFPDCNSYLNSQISTRWYQKFELAYKMVPYCISMSFTKFQGHTDWKIYDLALIWVFADENFSFILQTSRYWPELSISRLTPVWIEARTLNLHTKRHPIVIWCHSSNFKVTWAEKSIQLLFEHFQMLTSTSIHRWLGTDTHSF